MPLRIFGLIFFFTFLVGGMLKIDFALAQYDLSTCTGNQDLCIEWARRNGNSTTRCQGLYRHCMRTRTVPDFENPRNNRMVPIEPK